MVKLNRIYTRTGDAGETGLVDGSRVSKGDGRIAAMGDVDELNCAVGVARAHIADPVHSALLERIQNELFDLGADLATPGEDFTPSDMALRITAEQVTRLEREIDTMNEALAPLNSFILPAGEPGATQLHMARAVARRAERALVTAADAGTAFSPAARAYLNRLSDHLFVLARLVNAGGAGDVLWQPGKTRGG